jgi:hypothetical protein
MLAFIRMTLAVLLVLAPALSISTGCGGAGEAHGADAGSTSLRDSASEDGAAALSADDSGCGPSTGTVEVIVAAPVRLDACAWEIEMGSDSILVASGTANFPPSSSTFAVACLAAGSGYYISCTCPYSVLGPCTDGEFFSIAGGTTTQVVVDVACPA